MSTSLGLTHLDVSITGLDEPLGVTDTHPIWSETRQNFVVAGQLEVGEHLRSATGTLAQVTRITPRRGPPEVTYNLEIDGEHVYQVGATGVLIRNSCPVALPLTGRPHGGFEHNSAIDEILREVAADRLGTFERIKHLSTRLAIALAQDAVPSARLWNQRFQFSRNRMMNHPVAPRTAMLVCHPASGTRPWCSIGARQVQQKNTAPEQFQQSANQRSVCSFN